ncbi:hypothetical protein [Thermaurantiacus sp.]
MTVYASTWQDVPLSLDEYLDMHDTFFLFCGTTACAAGHPIAAGVLRPEKAQKCTSWNAMVKETYGVESPQHAFSWCFHHIWADIDNTPQGAGHRIGYTLQHGVPIRPDGWIAEHPDIYQPAENGNGA